MQNREVFGGIEAGGTKFVCGIGSGTGELLARTEFKTSTPTETIEQVKSFFSAYPTVKAIGIGSFGPLNLNRHSVDYGTILNTPKQGWSGVNLYKIINEKLDIPTKIITDTDAAALGEYYHGIGLGIQNFVYLTVGTGIGGSIMSNAELLHGISHPEIGHIRIPLSDDIKGVCIFHKDCLEGLASGQALEQIYGQPAQDITNNDIWLAEAEYIALGLANIINIAQPERIILGGSVLKHQGLLEQIRSHVAANNNNYIDLPDMESYIVQTSSDSIGVLGAIKLASLT